MTTFEEAANAYYQARNYADFTKRSLGIAKEALDAATLKKDQADDRFSSVHDAYLEVVRLYPFAIDNGAVVRGAAIDYNQARLQAEETKNEWRACRDYHKDLSDRVNAASTELSKAYQALIDATMEMELA